MAHNALNDLLGVTFFSGLITMVILGFVSLRDGSFLCQAHGEMMVFRKRPTLRAFLTIMGLFMVTGGPIGYWHSMMNAPDPDKLSATTKISMWAILALLTAAAGLLMIRFSGPEDLSLDLDRRTYHLVGGWPFFAVARSGGWDDMAGIYVKSAGTSGLIVGISWRYSKKQRTPLGRFGRQQPAEQFAQEMAAKLDLPRVSLPKS